MGSEIADTSRRPGLRVDQTTESGDSIFCFTAISELDHAPNNLLPVFPHSRAIVIPSEDPHVRTGLVYQLE
jgi:hypothetical protein